MSASLVKRLASCALFFTTIGYSLLGWSDTVTVIPANPDPSTPIQLDVQGVVTNYAGVYLYGFTVNGQTITLKGCEPIGFSPPRSYEFFADIGALSPGTYSIQYSIQYCLLQGQHGTPTGDPIYQSTTSFTVRQLPITATLSPTGTTVFLLYAEGDANLRLDATTFKRTGSNIAIATTGHAVAGPSSPPQSAPLQTSVDVGALPPGTYTVIWSWTPPLPTFVVTQPVYVGPAGISAITVTPWAPTSADVLEVSVFFGNLDCAISSFSESLLGNIVNVTIQNTGPSFLPNPPCGFIQSVGPLAPGTYQVIVTIVDGPTHPITLSAPVVVTASQAASTRPAVEFYNSAQDHYFLSIDPAEIHDLDTGVHRGWARTGQQINTGANAATGASPVCRFYIPPAIGDSHFFTVLPYECYGIEAAILGDFPFSTTASYVFESPNAFYMFGPDSVTGACPAATVPVFRLWNKRADSNHRYTTDPSIKAQMISKGWVAEGYGPNAVEMCAPQ